MTELKNQNLLYNFPNVAYTSRRGDYMLHFTKMTGLGNDYIYINCMDNNLKNIPELAKKLSDRHFGIGADGLILIDKPDNDKSDFKMRVFNSDGSEAEMCGNGIRCAAKFIHDNGLYEDDKIAIQTLAGVKRVKLIEGTPGEYNEAIVDMGEPIFQDNNIPYNIYEAFNKDLDLDVNGEKMRFTVVSMGNPHAITFVEDLDKIDIEKMGSAVENNPIFPNRTNVEFVQIIDKNNIKVRVWERGVGETFACGTGACAAMVASGLNGYTDESVTVGLKGGDLKVEWGKDNHIYMQGPATTVYEGKI